VLSGSATGTYTLAGTPTITNPTISTPSLTGDITADRLNTINGFRLSLTTALPVTIADVLAAETLYCVPYTGNVIALYSGSTWVLRDSAQFSIDIPDVTGVHDVFCYDNSGVPTLEVLVWTNDTTRATALTYQDGVLVKTGATTRRYLGTFYSTTAGNGQTEDSAANRYLCNYYHPVRKHFSVVDTTNSWTYGTATWRQAGALATNQANIVIGVSEHLVEATVQTFTENDTGSVTIAVGVGITSTTVNSAQIFGLTTAGQNRTPIAAHYRGMPAAGRVQMVWLEIASAGTTETFYGDNASTSIQGGLVGSCMV
jgi:hypothetical protein